jgi:hypothetical protein
MKTPGVWCILLVCLCIAVAVAGCTSSKAPAPATTPQSSVSAAVTAAPVAQATPSCPDKLVWDGSWDSRELGMAGNHDLGTAWTKYKDRAYGDETVVKMTQTCWDVEGTMFVKGVNCTAAFKGSVDRNVLSGTWSSLPGTCSKSQDGRKFALTMAADNQSFLGDIYDATSNPDNYPPNWAGRRNS